MKATGVVRKIDSLGRIVIPKEIRKNLKIRTGENLEIFVEEDAIFLKKFSSLSGITDFAQDFVDVLHMFTMKEVVVTDMCHIIAYSKGIKDNVLQSELSTSYLKTLEKRETFISIEKSTLKIVNNVELVGYYLLMPLVIYGELLGSIILFSEKEQIDEQNKMILKFVVKFLEKNLED